MERDRDSKLILQLLSEDLEDIEHKQKGKQRTGNLSDHEVALACMRHEILAARTSIEDSILAISTSAAIATDQKVLASLRQEETLATQDHHYALALNGDEQTLDAPHAGAENHNEDAVSIALGDIMDRVTIHNEAHSRTGGPTSASSSRAPVPRKECASCLEKCEPMLFMDSCRHAFCHDCTRQMFLGATKDEELYPPRCCGHIVTPGIAMRVLDYAELRSFSEKAMEYSAKDRVYCADATCSKFIPPFAIQDELATCPECHQQTHVPCRSLAHPHVDCPMDVALHDVLDMAEAQHWRRCYHCRAMVELQHGCGKEFCYVCGQAWKTCDCPLWHEDRLVAVVNEAVDEEVAPDANGHQRRNAAARIREDLLHHEDIGCNHHRQSQWVWRDKGLRCEICNTYMRAYIFARLLLRYGA
ncbi:Zinc finger, C6HC-type [Aspergillus terreus]|uniref:Zinc finger, C6HC-type n=1 Tax=Aspergillus terreus TaxID=33178 RepID=A0A5M3Z8J8_ASPTE|nr:hypothetical protein ATETN484_0009024900 [Aspergillus terreus]GFF17700.1 Zinc finger, C6HC-type [Aspergillus terreus]